MGRERVRNPGKCEVCGAGLYYDPTTHGGSEVDGGYFIMCSAPIIHDGARAHHAALWWGKEYEADAIMENWSRYGPQAVFQHGWPDA